MLLAIVVYSLYDNLTNLKLSMVRLQKIRRGIVMYIFLSIILVIMGAIMILKPRLFFDITESWKNYASSDPSDLYLFSTRLGGVLCLLVGIGGIVILVFLS